MLWGRRLALLAGTGRYGSPVMSNSIRLPIEKVEQWKIHHRGSLREQGEGNEESNGGLAELHG